MISLLQIYRGIAALLVVFYHARLTINDDFGGYAPLDIFYLGEAGVQFFFVLSGFIIYYIHKKDLGIASQFGSYLSKRLIRVYPIYILLTLMLAPMWLFVADFGYPYHKEIPALIKSFLLIPQDHKPHLDVAWTLTHEILFYIVFSFAIINKKIGKGVLAIWFLAIAIVNASGIALPFPLSFLLSINNLLFGMGILAAMLVSAEKTPIRYGLDLFIAGNIAFVIIATLSGASNELLHDPFYYKVFVTMLGLAAFLIIIQAKDPRLEAYFKNKTFLLMLGNASYSIYLFHYPTVSVLSKVVKAAGMESLHPLIIFIFFVVVSTACGIAAHFWLEKPMIAFLHRKLLHKKA